MTRIKNIIKSYTAMPLWVQIWIGLFLAPANIACIFFLDSNIGQAVAWAGVIVLLGNGPLCWLNQGFSKVLAIPHLIAWGPLQVYLAMQLFGGNWEASQNTYYFAWIVFTCNGISLAFDVVDTIEWFKGKRQISGFEDQEPFL